MGLKMPTEKGHRIFAWLQGHWERGCPEAKGGDRSMFHMGSTFRGNGKGTLNELDTFDCYGDM